MCIYKEMMNMNYVLLVYYLYYIHIYSNIMLKYIYIYINLYNRLLYNKYILTNTIMHTYMKYA